MSETTLKHVQERIATVRVPAVVPSTTRRLHSLDVFRGVTIAAMLLVNNPGSWAAGAVYPPLRHAEWHGWTPTDLIFPFFLFIVGVAMSFSFSKLLATGAGRGNLFRKSLKRAAILFGLGLVLHSFPWLGYDYSHLRIPGVLQRIALAFLGASILMLWMGWRSWVAATGVLLLGYWALLTWVPVPGVGAGVLEPGKDLGAFIDRAVFGTNHLRNSGSWDLLGLLSTLPAIASVLIGVLTGEWLRSGRRPDRITQGMLLMGGVGVALGLLWDQYFPINKPLWTSSYVLFAGGVAMLAFALCYWVVDVKRYRQWAFPFTLFGLNAIAAYFLSALMAKVMAMIKVSGSEGATSLHGWVYEAAFAPWLSPMNASLAFAMSFVLCWMLVMGVFYRKRIFLKV